MLRPVIALAFLMIVTGCDSVGEEAPRVRGRVVDAVTGGPLRGGFDAFVSVVASSNTALFNPGVLGTAVADGDGSFLVEAEPRGDYTISPRLIVTSTGRIEGPNPNGLPDSVLAALPALFPPYKSVEIYVGGGESDVGTVEMVPQGVVTVAATFDRLYREGERVVVRIQASSGQDFGATLSAAVATPSRSHFSLPAGDAVTLTWTYVSSEGEEALEAREVLVPLFEEAVVPVEITLPE